jgi:hypothetical protein
VTNEQEWRAEGAPWRNAPAIGMFAEMMRGYGFVVYTIGNESHLSADIPEDHTPYSHTPWPAGQPYPNVMALDIMPGGRVDWRRLGQQITNDKAMGKPGTEWIKYINYTIMDGSCWHSSWEPDLATRPSTDTGHVHLSCRSDLFPQTDFHGWDPVAELLAGGITPVSTPVPAGGISVEDIVGKLPTLQFGATGHYVRILEGLLVGHGYPTGAAGGPVDDTFGRVVDASVRQFQRDRAVANSVTASGHGDGKVGPNTWAALLDV